MKYIVNFILIIISLILLVGLIEFYYSGSFTSGVKLNEISYLHYAGMLVLTLMLLFVGYYQLSDLNKTTKADFLLRIDERWGSSEIIKARTIIQKYYREARKQAEDLGQKQYDHYDCIKRIQDEIHKAGVDVNKAEDFVYLMNLLDFMETVSYFTNTRKISKKDIIELSGRSLVFFYEIFEKWIEIKRDKYGSKDFYKEFEMLAKDIKDDRCFFCKLCKLH